MADIKREPIKTLPPRIHFDEFVKLYTSLSTLQVAGFKSIADNKEWMRKDEWQAHLDIYLGKNKH